MKNLIRLTSLALAALVFTSCQKELDGPEQPIVQKPVLTALDSFKMKDNLCFMAKMDTTEVNWELGDGRTYNLANVYPVPGLLNPIRSVAGLSKMMAFETVNITSPSFNDTSDAAIAQAFKLGETDYTTNNIKTFEMDFMSPNLMFPRIEIKKVNILQTKRIPGINSEWQKAMKVWMVLDFNYRAPNNAIVRVTSAKAIMAYYFKN
jgi:hypothetical protein